MSNPISEFMAVGQAILDEAKQHLGDTKIESLPSVYTKLSELAGVYPVPNLAVDLCWKMYMQGKQQTIEMGRSPAKAHQVGCLSYRSSMPKLAGLDNIRDFVACVAHGMCISVIPGAEGTRLLYAAQVAYSTLPSPKRRKKRHKTSQTRTETSQPNPDTSTT